MTSISTTHVHTAEMWILKLCSAYVTHFLLRHLIWS